MTDPITDILGRLAIVPAIVLEDANQSGPLAHALVAGGLPMAEVTLRTPAALEAVQRMAGFPDLLVGAGTVLNIDQAQKSLDAGAKFIVSPGTDARLIEWCLNKKLAIIPGACTPSEVMLAANLGVTCVKFFPCEVSGGLDMLKALHGPFPNMRFIPTGGITLETISDYLAFPPVLAVGGTWMVKPEWLRNDRFDVIEDACRVTVESVRDARWKMAVTARARAA